MSLHYCLYSVFYMLMNPVLSFHLFSLLIELCFKIMLVVPQLYFSLHCPKQD